MALLLEEWRTPLLAHHSLLFTLSHQLPAGFLCLGSEQLATECSEISSVLMATRAMETATTTVRQQVRPTIVPKGCAVSTHSGEGRP